MSHLIIGHVTETTARIWVRGRLTAVEARLSYRVEGSRSARETRVADLPIHRDFITVFELENLRPDTRYECELAYANGSPPPVHKGRFRTAPRGEREMTFLLGSCCYSKLGVLNSKNVEAAWTRIGVLAEHLDADFMIHCGDQVYADLPGEPTPTMRSFQDEYKRAWEFRPAARVLAGLPHYMILDDHEIVNDFANDKPYPLELWGHPTLQQVRDFGLEAYRQYQHCRNPQTALPPGLYYSFGFAGAVFFALDCRSERWSRRDTQMIGAQQMAAFKHWLSTHAAEPKFVVTSVPFVGEVRDADDKWCGEAYRAQREEILDHLAQNRINRLCFLTGDMHCSYYAQMRVTPPGGRGGPALTVHELMSSPINQVTTGLHAFIDRPERATAAGTRYQTLPFAAGQTYNAHSNVMAIRFSPTAGEVKWQVYRTKGEEVPPIPVAAGEFAL